MQTQISHDRYKRFVGTKQTLLVENYSKKTNNFMTGKIDGGQTTHISSKDIKTLYQNAPDDYKFLLKLQIFQVSFDD